MKRLNPGLRKVAVALYCSLQTPLSLKCEILLRYGEWDQLATQAIDPSHYIDSPWGAERFRRDAQAINFLRKSPLLPTSINRRKEAELTFDECEKQCYQSNRYLDLLKYPSNGSLAVYEDRLRAILARARKNAARILGKIPDDIVGRFGPGTSFELKGQRYSTAADKLWVQPHATKDCMPLFEHAYWPTNWGRTRLRLGLPLPCTVRGNRFTTVPKDATKDRGICVEPQGNLWCQLGIGGHLKRRLSYVGIRVDRNCAGFFSLNGGTTTDESIWASDGQEVHKELAREGSLKGIWATIDLSNASDTICYELVRAVLPPEWFELLWACRSPYTLINGVWVRLEKFSSMGNGFTFELETLIFLCLAAAVTGELIGERLFCYGDDIVLPAEHFDDVMALLTACGLQPNMKKSYATGPFRESCGGDFFAGIPVRGYYADKDFESPLHWVSMHNRLKQLWPKAKLAHRRCIDQVPGRLRVFGPARLGDRVLMGSPLRVWCRDGCRWVATIATIPTKVPLDRWGEEFTLTLALLGAPSSGLTPRDSIEGYRITEASVS